MAYLPTINQTALVREALDAYGFGMAETVEILRRTWHVEGRSIRPDHRMVAHTGFLTFARRLVVDDDFTPRFGQRAEFSALDAVVEGA
jgi:tRNA (adenine57-N1/adenine58-N1)-methyltransferase